MKKFTILFLILIIFNGCLGTKKIFENNKSTKEKEKIEKTKDSTSVKEKSKAIKDDFNIPVKKVETDDKKFDEAVNKEVDNILSRVNTSKKSGNNSYSVYYDKKRRKIRVNVEIGETVNSNTTTNSNENYGRDTEQNTFNSVYKRIFALPWYVYLILIIVFLPKLLGFFSPHLSLIKNAIPKKPIYKEDIKNS